MTYKELPVEQRHALLNQLRGDYIACQTRGLKLDMSRGKPCKEQLDISMDLLNAGMIANNACDSTGFDTRNYGVPDGIPECRALFAELLEISAENVLVFGNSSLNIMYDLISQYWIHGTGAGTKPWSLKRAVKVLCPVPGYDRHFAILEHFGIEMVPVPTNSEGPDLHVLAELVADPAVKGMFCVPKYSNPTGITFSDETVCAIAALTPAATDFRVIWDNAYCVHDVREGGEKLLNIFAEAAKHGHEEYFIEVTSTSKITFPGAGVSVLAASKANVAAIKARLAVQTIGHDKLNQLRHVRYFKNAAGILAHMQKHRAILEPKFDAVLASLERNLGGLGIAEWTNPRGGYFISLDVPERCAKRVGELCKEAGVVLTPSGATYPKGIDPKDRNIRIAPTLPPIHELETAAELLCLCVKIAALERLEG
ncbi:MAG: aminotransferase class I/II-fold pyridoxal phosphate-dependent enzyme [Oscillospiraceae bacterium]|jgi:DNA-binding transcriptional MocR family regulator|nr:aminotransferase class I/II-fold pyridoxal phosphate-dependent enzyme [Oscillospiraceae bacterium]